MAEISSQFSLAAHKFPSDMSLWKFWVKVYEGEVSYFMLVIVEGFIYHCIPAEMVG